MTVRMRAGAASVPIAPPLGVDMMGFLRRSEPARGYGRPMEANALVLESGGTRVVLVGADIVGVVGTWGQEIRSRIGAAVDCPADHVLVNAQHTHAAPPIPGFAKIGGDPDWNEIESRHGVALADLIVSAAVSAARRMRPARVGAARTTVDGISVNRRQRQDGATILGWNPDEACDRDVAVIRVDGEDGGAVATVVAFACHPVVVGPEVPEASSDFIGPLRRRIRDWTGGECLFLQGCAGNILPFEAFHDHTGPEYAFADTLALAALRARDQAAFLATRPEQAPFRSAVPIAIWRHVPTGEEPDTTLAAIERITSVPLQELPSLEEIGALRRELEQKARDLQEQGAPRTAWNPLVLHSRWAAEIERRIADGSQGTTVAAPVQAIRIGPVCITAWPCEPFCELGLEVKERSPAPFPIALGYSNDLIGYVPTRREYPLGGYEPVVAQRHFGQPTPYAPEAGELLVAEALALTERLFAEG